MDIINSIVRKKDFIIKTVLFVSTIAVIVALFPKDYTFKYEFQKSKPWMYEDLIAPFDFAVKKSDAEILAEKKQIYSEVRPYYFYNNKITGEKRRWFIRQFNEAWQTRFSDSSSAAAQQNLKQCLSVFDSLYARGIIQRSDETEGRPDDFTIIIVKNKIAEEKELRELFSLQSAQLFIQNRFQNARTGVAQFNIDILTKSLFQNVVYDPESTYHDKVSRIGNLSLTRGIVQRGEGVISKGELINDEKFLELESLRQEYEGQAGNLSNYYFILGGQTILISIAIIVLVLFLSMFRKDILADNKKIALILSLIMLMVLTTSLVIRKFDFEYIRLVPLCLVPFIIRAFSDTRLALFVHIVTVIIIGFLVPNGFEFIFLQLIAGIVTIISIVNLEKRSQFFLTSFYVFFTYSLIYTGMCLMQDGGIENVEPRTFGLFAVCSLMMLFAYPIIYFYERIFGFVTAVSLLEYSNTNSRVLRELALKAPGTFQHSLQVANLAEEAAYRVEGNALLARTGGLYHDLGKMAMPGYYVENQLGGYNPHKEIGPQESAGIIISHVENGINLAKKYKLPEPIIDFIRTHHGTKKTEYFYSMYKMSHPNDTDDSHFTYVGPLPYTKETAIVMMADAVEAASKSLRMPDKQTINDLVESIIDRQIEMRQFKNTSITFRDISRIKIVFKNRLMNIYQLRIEYPS
ncbi:MAG: HDIG domain-containing metalloprotein [Bacteroidota bacterium]